MNNLSLKKHTRIIPWEAILSGSFVFNPELPVSKKSRFGDAVWDWTNEDDRRLKVLDDSKLRFDWGSVTVGAMNSPKVGRKTGKLIIALLPAGIIEDIKRSAFLYAASPNLAGRIATKASGRKPISVVYFIKGLVNFFSYLYMQNVLPSGASRIRTLSDITLSDIRQNLETYPYRVDGARKVLMKMCDQVIKSNMKNPPAWTLSDLRNLRWREEKTSESIPPLPDELFRLLSEASRRYVVNFLKQLGETVCDNMDTRKTVSMPHWERFPEMFESYIKRRQVTRERGSGWESNHTKEFVEEFGEQVEVLRDFLMDVQCAAQTIILLYSAMRYSEAASLRAGCITEKNGVYLLRSTVIKGRKGNLPADADEWIAIDIVRDAVRTLEIISRCSFNNFLFGTFETVRLGENENPLSIGGLNERLNHYLRRIDAKGKWRDWKLSTHQFRHGLVSQLAKAEVGIAYITRQLHHYYTKLNESAYRTNETTLVYGLQKQRLLANATGLNAVQQAHGDILRDLYGENKKFAGGGAARHVERTEAFFNGTGMQGKAREKYIENLTKSGVAMVHTAVGWCTRNHAEPQVKEESETPPCIGDLQCNPAACKHSVVPEGRKDDVVRLYRNAVKESRSPDQIHLRKYWEEKRDSFAAMLAELGIDPASIGEEANN